MRPTINKYLICVALFLMSNLSMIFAGDHFENATLRYDFYLYGNSQTQNALFARAAKQDGWAGNPNKMIPSFEYGDYCIKIWDQSHSELLFFKGFSNLFLEWRTTPEANNMDKISIQTQLLPFPKHPVLIEIMERDSQTQSWASLNIHNFDPNDHFIEQEGAYPYAQTKNLYYAGDAQTKFDLTILAEGYTKDEIDKFYAEAQKMADYFMSFEPYKSNTSKINIRAVFAPSDESGPDEPKLGNWRRTLVNSTFDTFGTDRYLTVPDASNVWTVLSGIPTEIVCVLVNSSTYGGGGFYNTIAVTSSNHQLSREVFLHELGHCIAGLGDEYFESEVAYESFYDLKVEPWEPNITTLVDFKSKWEDMIKSGKYGEKLGLFEGGGYTAKGVFRPVDKCRMRVNDSDVGFCPVCSRAIEQTLSLYSE